MATRKSEPKQFKVTLHHDMHSDYCDVIYKWSYHTVSDHFTIIAEYENTIVYEFGAERWGKNCPEVLLFMLSDWMAAYNGPEKLRELLKPIFEKYEDE